MTRAPFVSVIVPVRNEARYIEGCLRSLLQSGYPPARWELLLVDGMSDDATRETIARVAATAVVPIRMLDNPHRAIPHALNIGIRAARGEIIIRADAHAAYPPNYVARCARLLRESGADNVGGPVATVPGSDTAMARAIARLLSHPLGVGNSAFRTAKHAQEADTVPFGCYPAELFRRIGLFDERLHRNEDYEFNARLRRAGGRIVLDPRLESTYYSRATLGGLLRQAWVNGFWNAMSHYLHPACASPRHVLPLLFTLGAVALPLVPLPWGWPLRAGYALYALLVLAVALQHPRLGPSLLIAFPLFHLTYGAGIAWGWLRLLLGWKPWRRDDTLPRLDQAEDRAAA